MLTVSEAEAAVENFLKKAHVGSPANMEEFWSEFLREHGIGATDFRNLYLRGSDIGKLYRVMHTSEGLANAVISQFESPRLRAAAVWLLQGRIPTAGKVLDLGCGSGLLLCLLASCYPNTHFLGLDKCEEAIEIARERAAGLGLRNVEFRIGNVARGFVCTVGDDYDLVFSVALFHEVLVEKEMSEAARMRYYHFLPDRPINPCFSVSEMDRLLQCKLTRHTALASMAKVLKQNGTILSIDRWPGIRELLKWIRLTEAHDLTVFLNESEHIVFESRGPDDQLMTERLPATVFRKVSAQRPTALDVLRFCVPQMSEQAHQGGTYEGDIAELVYSTLPRQSGFAYEAEYPDGSGIERCEIGLSGDFGYLYRTTTCDYRSLVLSPGSTFSGQAQPIQEMFRKHFDDCTVKFRECDPAVLQQLRIPLKETFGPQIHLCRIAVSTLELAKLSVCCWVPMLNFKSAPLLVNS